MRAADGTGRGFIKTIGQRNPKRSAKDQCQKTGEGQAMYIKNGSLK